MRDGFTVETRAASWPRLAAASPACPVQAARLARVVRVSGCSGALDKFADGQQGGELVAGPRSHPRPGRLPPRRPTMIATALSPSSRPTRAGRPGPGSARQRSSGAQRTTFPPVGGLVAAAEAGGWLRWLDLEYHNGIDTLNAVSNKWIGYGSTCQRRPEIDLCVPKTSSTLCDQAVFVDQATDTRFFFRTRHCSRSTGSGSGFSGAAPSSDR
jgi:hypothetical protein